MHQPYDRIADLLAPHYLERSHELDLSRFSRYLGTGACVLDAGCGVGRDVADLRHLGFRAVGLDESPRMISIASHQFGDHFAVGNLLRPPFRPGSFQGIWSMSVLSLLDEHAKRAALQIFARLLVVNGLLFFAVWDGEGKYVTNEIVEEVPRTHFLISPSKWTGLLTQCGFRPIETIVENVNPERPPAFKVWATKAGG